MTYTAEFWYCCQAVIEILFQNSQQPGQVGSPGQKPPSWVRSQIKKSWPGSILAFICCVLVLLYSSVGSHSFLEPLLTPGSTSSIENHGTPWVLILAHSGDSGLSAQSQLLWLTAVVCVALSLNIDVHFYEILTTKRTKHIRDFFLSMRHLNLHFT